jgi:DNA-binding transcriptional ArsR family regulator
LLEWLVALSERSTDIQNIQPNDPLAVRLVEAAGLRDACDLDLLLFFSRHPRVVLSSEQLAAYVGYELPQVARALDLLLGAGLLKRTLNQGATGRMYVLEVDHAEEWLESLRHVCATSDGRNALKVLLKQRQSQNGDPSHRRPSGVRPS